MAFRSSSHTGSGNDVVASFPVPTGAASGDIAVASFYLQSAATVTPPTGFTLKSDIDAGSHHHLTYWKRLTGADSGTYDFTWSGSAYREGACALFSGRATSGDPFESFGTNTAASTTVTVTALSPAASGDDLVGIATNFNGGAWTAPSGMTEREDQGIVITLDTADAVASGSTGNKTFTCGSSGNASAFLGALLPAGGGGSSLTANPADNVGLTDSATRVNDAVRTSTDAVGTTDSLAATADRVRTPTDSLGVTDSLSVTNAAQRSPTDAVGLTDSLSVTWDRVVTISDGMGISDPGQNIDTGTNVTDALGITDSVSVSQTAGVLVADGLGLTDSLGIKWDRVATIADSLGMGDANVKGGDISASLADGLGITDTLTAVFDVPVPAVTHWRFIPPTRPVRVVGDSLWERVTRQVGQAVLRMQDGSFRTVNIYDPNLTGVAAVYLGGYVHTISDAEAALLTAAGYGEFLTEVTE